VCVCVCNFCLDFNCFYGALRLFMALSCFRFSYSNVENVEKQVLFPFAAPLYATPPFWAKGKRKKKDNNKTGLIADADVNAARCAL